MTVLGTREDGGDLVMDLAELLTSGAFIQGNSGSGKSGLIRRLLEQTHGRVQQIVLDAQGDYVTLSQGFAYVLCGEGFQVPATVDTAGRLAVKLYDAGVSAVVDISGEKLAEQRRFVRAFIEDLMFHALQLRNSGHHLLIVIDELQLFAPQQTDSESTEAIVDFAHRGRRLGLHPILATQRLSSVSKDAVSEIPNKLFGRTTLDVDQRRVAQELGLDTQTRRLLGRLQTRQFYAYGPALSQDPVIFTVADVATPMPKIGELSSFIPPPPSEEVLAALAALAAVEPVGAENAQTAHGAPQEKAAGSSSPAPPPCDHEPIITALNERVYELISETFRLGGIIEDLTDRIREARTTLGDPEAIEAMALEEDDDENHDAPAGAPRAGDATDRDGGGGLADDARRTRRSAGSLKEYVTSGNSWPQGKDTEVDGDDRGRRPVGGPPGNKQADPPVLPGDGLEPSGVPGLREGDGPSGLDARVRVDVPARVQRQHRSGTTNPVDASRHGRDTEDMKDEEVEALIRKLMRDSGRVLVVPPAEVIRQDYLSKAIDRIMLDLKELSPDALECYRLLVSREAFMTVGQISQVISGYQGGAAQVKWGSATKALLDAGLVSKGGSGGNGFKANDEVARQRVVRVMEPHLATDEEIDNVWQMVLGRMAGMDGVLV